MATPSYNFKQVLDGYAKLLAEPPDLKEIAEKTVTLDRLAHSVNEIAFKAVSDLEKLLRAPLSIPGQPQPTSLLMAAQHYMQDPTTLELSQVITELNRNTAALDLLRQELNFIASSIGENR